MKTPHPISKYILGCVAALIASSSASYGTVVVGFDMTDTVATGQDFKTFNDSNVASSFSLSTPFAEAADFAQNSSTAPTNPTIYGNFQMASSNAGARSIDNGIDSTDALRIGPASQTSYSFNAIWKKEDFLNGGASTDVNITATDSLSFRGAVTTLLSATFAKVEYRWLIVKDTSVYATAVDVEATDLTATALATVSSGNLTTQNWYSVDFASDSWDAGTLVVDPVATGLFSDIDGIGLVLSSPAADIVQYGTYLNAFTADLTVIPEPSSAVLGFAALGLAVLRRRVRRA